MIVQAQPFKGEVLQTYSFIPTASYGVLRRIKAEMLLEILDKEEENRTMYTYHKLPQANKEPAQESITNAQFFISHIKAIIKNQNKVQ